MRKKHFYIALILLAVPFKGGFPEGAVEEGDSGTGEFLPSEETPRAVREGPVYRPGILPLRTADGKAEKNFIPFLGAGTIAPKKIYPSFPAECPLGPGRTDRQFSPGKKSEYPMLTESM